jgi:hypothetical protein
MDAVASTTDADGPAGEDKPDASNGPKPEAAEPKVTISTLIGRETKPSFTRGSMYLPYRSIALRAEKHLRWNLPVET